MAGGDCHCASRPRHDGVRATTTTFVAGHHRVKLDQLKTIKRQIIERHARPDDRKGLTMVLTTLLPIGILFSSTAATAVSHWLRARDRAHGLPVPGPRVRADATCRRGSRATAWSHATTSSRICSSTCGASASRRCRRHCAACSGTRPARASSRLRTRVRAPERRMACGRKMARPLVLATKTGARE